VCTYGVTLLFINRINDYVITYGAPLLFVNRIYDYVLTYGAPYYLLTELMCSPLGFLYLLTE
jgi:hypothetical protein